MARRHAPSLLRADDVRATLAASVLRDLEADELVELLGGATRITRSAGAVTYGEGDTELHLHIVVDGLARVFVSGPDGRTMTIRYCRQGSMLGAISLYARSFEMPASIQCLVDTTFLVLDPGRVRRLIGTDPRVAQALMEELSERVLAFIAEIAGSAFSTVKQRIARHLLDLSSDAQMGAELVVRLSQQDLAEATGTSREVVVRTLREFRSEGVLETTRGAVVVLDPVKLHASTYDPTLQHEQA